MSTAIVVACWLTVRPLGITGLPGATTLLLLANSGFVLARNTRPGLLPYRIEIVAVLSWAAAAAAVLAVDSLSVAPAFAYLVAGHAGYRLRRRDAVVSASMVGLLSAAGLSIAGTNGLVGWPWLLGLTVALPVFLGMANRSRDLAVQSAIQAAAASERAAESEAQPRALAERARIWTESRPRRRSAHAFPTWPWSC